MTRLRKMMLDELERRNYSQNTRRLYLHAVAECAQYFHGASGFLVGGPPRSHQFPVGVWEPPNLGFRLSHRVGQVHGIWSGSIAADDAAFSRRLIKRLRDHNRSCFLRVTRTLCQCPSRPP
jgi:hypothetical protein